MDWKQRAKEPVGGREWKEAIKRFSGDPALSAQYLPLARVFLGGLVQQLRLGGIEQGHRIVELPDGTHIRVLHNSGINTVEITTFPTFGEVFTTTTSGGFIFYPRIKGVRQYPSATPHGLMTIKCLENEAQVKIIAPAKKEYGGSPNFASGGQFVFFGQDVYSWDHWSYGDYPYPGLVGSSRIIKNGSLWRTLSGSQQIIGFRPVEVEVTNEDGDRVDQMRYLTVRRGANFYDTSLYCYIDEGDELVELGDSIQLFEDEDLDYDTTRYWPCRFKTDGSEGAMMFRYNQQFPADYSDINSFGSTILTDGVYTKTFYNAVIMAITHDDESISATLSYVNEGFTQDKLKAISTKDQQRSSQKTPSNFYESLGVPATGTSFNASNSIELSGTDNDESTNSLEGSDQQYAVALNYVPVGELEQLTFAYLRDNVGNGFSRSTTTRSIESSREFVKSMTRPNIYSSWTVLADREDYSYEFENSYITDERSVREFEISIDGKIIGRVNPQSYGFYSERTEQGEYHVWGPAALNTIHGYSESYSGSYSSTLTTFSGDIAIHYLDVRNHVVAITAYRFTSTKETSGTNSGDSPFVQVPPAIEYIYANSEFVFVPGTEPEIRLDGDSPFTGEIDTDQGSGYTISGGIDLLSKDEEYSYSRIFTRYINRPYPIGSGGTTQVSYVKDERVDCKKEAWAYSIKHEGKYLSQPFIVARCTYDLIGNLLPKLDGDNEPTEEKLADPELTVYPIGLY